MQGVKSCRKSSHPLLSQERNADLLSFCRQPFALATEHEQLKRRVAQLEAYIFKQGGIEFDPSLLGPDHHHATTAEVDELDEDSEGRDSDTEDAALVLEELGTFPSLSSSLFLRSLFPPSQL